jgi:hypothetical protein
MGKQRGFDMESEEGIDKWMMTYNAEVMSDRGLANPPSDFGRASGFGFGGGRKRIKVNKQAKVKRKAEKASRKKNRRR